MCVINVTTYVDGRGHSRYIENVHYCQSSDSVYPCGNAIRNHIVEPTPGLSSPLSQSSPISENFPPTPPGGSNLIERRPSTKSREHRRHNSKSYIKPEVTIRIGNPSSSKKNPERQKKYHEKSRKHDSWGSISTVSSTHTDIAVVNSPLANYSPSASLTPSTNPPLITNISNLPQYKTVEPDTSSLAPIIPSSPTLKKSRPKHPVFIEQAIPPTSPQTARPNSRSIRISEPVIIPEDRRRRDSDRYRRQDVEEIKRRADESKYYARLEQERYAERENLRRQADELKRQKEQERISESRSNERKKESRPKDIRPKDARPKEVRPKDDAHEKEYLLQKEYEQQRRERELSEKREQDERAVRLQSEIQTRLEEEKNRYRTRPLPVQPGHPSHVSSPTGTAGYPVNPISPWSQQPNHSITVRSPTRPQGRTLTEQGRDVIAGERARYHSRELNERLGNMSLNDDQDSDDSFSWKNTYRRK